MRKKLGCEIVTGTYPNGNARKYFSFQGLQVLEPASRFARDKSPLAPTCKFMEIPGGGMGPDDQGSDELISSPDELDTALEEVVSRMTQLDSFAWQTQTAPMPLGVFKALEELTTLRHLHEKYSAYTDSFFVRKSPFHHGFLVTHH